MIVDRQIGNIPYKVDTSRARSLMLREKDYRALGSRASDLECTMDYVHDNCGMEERQAHAVVIELTNACNFKCRMCYIRGHKFFTYLDYDSLIEAIDQLVEEGMMVCTLTGGEPFLHPRFKDIYIYLKRKGVLVIIYSNLSLLSSELMEVFTEYPPCKVEVTLYGHDNETFCSVTGQNSFTLDTVLDNVLKLKQAGITVFCKTTVTRGNVRSVEQIRSICRSHDIPYYFSYDLHSDYYGNSKDEYEISIEEKKELLTEQVKSNGRFFPESVERKDAFHCEAVKYSCYISYDFKMRLCHKAYRIRENGQFDLSVYSVKECLQKIEDLISPYRDRKLSFCPGCRASRYCKSCVIDQIVYDQDRSEGKHSEGETAEKCRLTGEMFDHAAQQEHDL